MWITFQLIHIVLDKFFIVLCRFVHIAIFDYDRFFNVKIVFKKRDPIFYGVPLVYIYYWKILENSTNSKHGSVGDRRSILDTGLR